MSQADCAGGAAIGGLQDVLVGNTGAVTGGGGMRVFDLFLSLCRFVSELRSLAQGARWSRGQRVRE